MRELSRIIVAKIFTNGITGWAIGVESDKIAANHEPAGRPDRPLWVDGGLMTPIFEQSPDRAEDIEKRYNRIKD